MRTGAEADAGLEAVLALERHLLQPDVRASRPALDRLLADDFTEIGASGRMFGKAEVLRWLPAEDGAHFDFEPVSVRWIADDLAQVVYRARRTLASEVRHTLRCSLWRRSGGDWKMIFHQGTVVPEEAR